MSNNYLILICTCISPMLGIESSKSVEFILLRTDSFIIYLAWIIIRYTVHNFMHIILINIFSIDEKNKNRIENLPLSCLYYWADCWIHSLSSWKIERLGPWAYIFTPNFKGMHNALFLLSCITLWPVSIHGTNLKWSTLIDSGVCALDLVCRDR